MLRPHTVQLFRKNKFISYDLRSKGYRKGAKKGYNKNKNFLNLLLNQNIGENG